MNLQPKRAFVTGADGFVGSHLARSLVEAGVEVGGFLHKPICAETSGLLNWNIADRVRSYVGDISNQESLEVALTDFNPDLVFHLAANSIVTKAQEHAFDAVETNIKGTYNLICLAARLPNIQGVIVASSDKAYGESPQLPYTENMPLRGGSVYDSSKACAEMIAGSLAARLRLPLLITRCANIYGPGDLHFSRIVPDAIRSIIRGELPIIRGSGLHERSFIYIDDAISGYMRMAERLMAGKSGGEAFNLGPGTSIRILDLVRMILEISGLAAAEPVILGHENFEIMKQCVNADKAREVLGWRPEISLRDGLKRTIDWYRARLV
jgi:CDP-glucose 4,6-dehydratase